MVRLQALGALRALNGTLQLRYRNRESDAGREALGVEIRATIVMVAQVEDGYQVTGKP